MIIYKVAHNYHKGIQEVEALSINNDGTFNYEFKGYSGIRLRKQSFIPKESWQGQGHFFINHEDAKKYLVDKLNKSIEKHEAIIKKSKDELNSLEP